MKSHLAHQTSARPQPTLTPAPGIHLQRKCACGQHTGTGGECDQCRKERLALQHGAVSADDKLGSSGKSSAAKLQTFLNLGFGYDFSRVQTGTVEPEQAQPQLRINQPGDKYEQEAERVADDVMRTPHASLALHIGGNRHRLIQRVCSECQNEIKLRAANRDDEEGIKIQAKTIGATNARTGVTDAGPFQALKGRGQPLSPSTRTFFEQRMGRHFGDVRVHTGAHADELAKSVNARAFTYRNHVVFGAGEYAPDSSGGRHLLAHELAHTIQQGAAPPAPDSSLATAISGRTSVQQSGAPELQRLCSDLATPPPMTCNVGTTSPGSSGTSILFGVNSATLSPAAMATVQSVAAAWHAGGGAGILRIDGFASIEGREEHNCPLSCDRANAVAAELFAPSDGSPGVPVTNLEILAQGETDQFSSSLAPNRRVVITTTGGAPAPGPACGLTVTGPDEVDHYCAAYVPSDAASCGVFPAPNITLTVAGAAPGTTPTWNIVRGGANASIAGATTGASVNIQGDAASAAQGDVTVQVTDGTCTTTHRLTVREPSQMTAAETPSSGPTFVQDIITYTVSDQFGNPMGAGICVDETVTICANSHGVPFGFGDAATNVSGQVTDRLNVTFPGGIPASLCIKLDQVLTAGGCGPLLHNTILFQAAGVTLTQGSSCAVGDPCP